MAIGGFDMQTTKKIPSDINIKRKERVLDDNTKADIIALVSISSGQMTKALYLNCKKT